MRIAIVDDDAIWRECIKNEIVRFDKQDEMIIDVFSGGEQYLMSKKHFDISFIDIEMQGIDGFETISRAREYNPDCFYVILTTHLEMSRKGYVVNAFRYIDKMKLGELGEAIESAQKLLRRDEKIEVNIIGEGVRGIALKNIVYIETEKHYVLIHTKQGICKCSNYMKEVEEMLPRDWFCRCHNVYIVNLDEIYRMNDRMVYLSNGDNIDVSYRRMSEFKKLYINRQYECANK